MGKVSLKDQHTAKRTKAREARLPRLGFPPSWPGHDVVGGLRSPAGSGSGKVGVPQIA